MPASLTRRCPSCGHDRATPDDFRELGEVGPGRPPKHCRDCRDKHPALAAITAKSRTKRAARRSLYRRYVARPRIEIEAYRARVHPDGLKTCPPGSGCGRPLDFSHFDEYPSQPDGLRGVCQECAAEAAALRALKRSTP